MRCGLTRAQIRLVGVDELGLRAIGHDGLAVEADAGQDGVERLGADAALDRRRADLAQESLETRPLRPRRPALLLDLRALPDGAPRLRSRAKLRIS